MRIAQYVPNVGMAEVGRHWLTPAQTCELAAVGRPEDPSIGKLLSNLADRGHLVSIKSGAAKTAARLFSLKSALMLRAMKEATAAGLAYEHASEIAGVAGELLEDIVEHYDELDQLDAESGNWLVIFSVSWNGEVCFVKAFNGENPSAATIRAEAPGGFITSVLAVGELAWNVLRLYADRWAQDLAERNIGADKSRYRGCDSTGYPLDPAHPWNQNLPPLERAKRLLEIEEYIAAREAEEGKHKDEEKRSVA